MKIFLYFKNKNKMNKILILYNNIKNYVINIKFLKKKFNFLIYYNNTIYSMILKKLKILIQNKNNLANIRY